MAAVGWRPEGLGPVFWGWLVPVNRGKVAGRLLCAGMVAGRGVLNAQEQASVASHRWTLNSAQHGRQDTECLPIHNPAGDSDDRMK